MVILAFVADHFVRAGGNVWEAIVWEVLGEVRLWNIFTLYAPNSMTKMCVSMRGTPSPQKTLICGNFATISSSLCRTVPMSDPPFPNYKGEPLQWGKATNELGRPFIS